MNENPPITKQSDATDVAACTCASLRKTTRVVTQAYNDALRSVNLTATQFTILANLAGHGKTPLTRLAEALVMDRTTLTRNLKPLVRRNLIRIEQEDDRRVRNIILTDVGRQLFEEALPGWEQIQIRISKSLGQERWAGLLADLGETVTAVGRM